MILIITFGNDLFTQPCVSVEMEVQSMQGDLGLGWGRSLGHSLIASPIARSIGPAGLYVNRLRRVIFEIPFLQATLTVKGSRDWWICSAQI